MENLTAAATHHVLEFHRFLTGWLGGTLPADAARLKRHLSTFHDDFLCISPDAETSGLHELRSWLPEAYGKKPGLHIEIRNVQPRHVDLHSVLLTYEEWQTGSSPNARYATALFVRKKADPAAAVWLHLHEGWLSRPGT